MLLQVELLIGNPAKAKAKLGWTPKIGMKQLCQAALPAIFSRGVAN